MFTRMAYECIEMHDMIHVMSCIIACLGGREIGEGGREGRREGRREGGMGGREGGKKGEGGMGGMTVIHILMAPQYLNNNHVTYYVIT